MIAVTRFLLCVAFCGVSAFILVNGSIVPYDYKVALLRTPVGVGGFAFSIVLCAIALYHFLDAVAIEVAARIRAMKSQENERVALRVWVDTQVPQISRGQEGAAARHYDWRVGKVVAANNGSPMPNRKQVGSPTYGV